MVPISSGNAAPPPKLRLRRFGLSGRFNIVFLAVLLIAGFNILSLRSIFHDADGVAETINIAGKLRMLSQKMAFELAVALQGGRQQTQVRHTMRDYETALAALEQGGEAFGLRIRPLSPALHPYIATLRTDWSIYRSHIDEILAGTHDRNALDVLQAQADEMLANAEQLVAALNTVTHAEQRRALQHLYTLCAIEAGIFSIAVLLIRRRLVRPLVELARATRALSNGRYDWRIEFRSRDEIGELVSSFNAAALRIGSLIGEIKHEHEQLLEAESMFRGLAENSIVGVCIVQENRFVFVNQTLAHMFCYDRQHMLDTMHLFDIIDDACRPDVEEIMRRGMRGEVDSVIYEVRGRRSDGSTLDVEVFGSTMDVNGSTAMLGVMLDVTTRRAQQRELEYLANHDALTGLANRNLLSDRIHQAVAMAQRAHNLVAVLLLDLNDFKVVNDSLGHGAGDTLLQQVAQRLQLTIREGDTLARFGGDEFVIVMPNVARPSEAAVVAHKILGLFAKPFELAGQEILVNTSIGIAIHPQDGDAEALIKSADLAMYRAKRERRDGFRFYSEELNLRNHQRLALAGELHHAVDNDTLRLEYQPKICLRSGRIIGAEALLRWQHPRLGRVAPNDFIPLAEETGLIVPIGEWVIRTACAQNRHWRDAGVVLDTLAVNVSGKQLRNARLFHCLHEALRAHELPAASMELELTESILMELHDEVVATIQQLRRHGVKFSMDDFGTGYSSLTYLRRLPFDHLKLDKSFIADISGDGGEIVKTVIALGRVLGLRTVAEGVEREDQVRFLQTHGCDEAQGFYFSPALPPNAFAELIARQPVFTLPPIEIV